VASIAPPITITGTETIEVDCKNRIPVNARHSSIVPPFAACSRVRAGTRVPHPRHWDALIGPIKGKDA
jgi:hypothetical protein